MKRRGDGARLASELLQRALDRQFYRVVVCGSPELDAFRDCMRMHGHMYFPTSWQLDTAIRKGDANGKP